jgi:hypothetical protein
MPSWSIGLEYLECLCRTTSGAKDDPALSRLAPPAVPLGLFRCKEVTPHVIGGLLCLAAMVPALALLAWGLLSKGQEPQ